MKFTIKELKGAIKLAVEAQVKEEIKKVLPRLIAEALSERYLKKVMAEVVRPAAPARQPSKLRELMQGDEDNWEEETPQAMENEHQGIYHQSPLVRGKGGPKNESVRRQMLSAVYGDDPENVLTDDRERPDPVQKISQGNPAMAAMFEGTRPAIPESSGGAVMGETQQQFGEEGVPLDFLGKIGVNFSNIQRNLEGNAPPAARERVDEEQAQRLARKWGKPKN